IPGYENRRVTLVPYTSAAAFHSASSTYDPNNAFYVGPGLFYDAVDGRIHVRLSKTPEMREMEARYGPVLPNENEAPRNQPMLVTDPYSTMSVWGSYLVFKDLTFQFGTRTIQLAAGAHDIVFDGVTVWAGDSAISVTG